MSRRSAKRDAWLSVTPKPETELPATVATLRAGGSPTLEGLRRERERIERLVLHGSERSWLAYLSEVVGLIGRSGAAAVEPAREAAADVVLNHHQLLLGLPGDAAERTAAKRELLATDHHADTHDSNDPGRNGHR